MNQTSQATRTEPMPGTLDPILATPLSDLAGISHGFFTRRGGVSGGLYRSLNAGQGSDDDKGHVARNRDLIGAHLGTTQERLLTVHQIHSADCLSVSAPWQGDRPKADAMVTSTPGLALGVLTADCGPVLFADGQARVIGAAHAGWKGAAGGVLEATVAAMVQHGAVAERIVAVLGPTISQSAYEVGPEFVERFIARDHRDARFFAPSERDGHAMFDLPGFIGQQLGKVGIQKIADLALCTYSDEERFFSYRRATHRGEQDYGRLIGAIMLEDPRD